MDDAYRAPVYDLDNELQENVEDIAAAVDDEVRDEQTSECPESWIFSDWCAYCVLSP